VRVALEDERAVISTAAYNRIMKEFATSEKNAWTLKNGRG
jgi:hypothetical protein